MILEIFNGYVRGHYNAFIHTVVLLTAEHERARTHTHIHSLYCRTTLLLENDSLRHLRSAVGRRVTNKSEALAHLPLQHPLADGRLIASAPCVGHLIITIPLPFGYPLSPSGCPDSNLFLLANFFESCSFFRGSGSNFKSFYLIK